MLTYSYSSRCYVDAPLITLRAAGGGGGAKISGKSVQLIVCPRCGGETPLPLGGVAALPLNTLLQRRLVAAAMLDDRSSVLCDLCTTDNKAERHCSQCLVSVCSSCGNSHDRRRHSLRPLIAPAPTPTLTCALHPHAELSVYCATCQQVVCRSCCIISHGGHALSGAARAAAERARLLRAACERATHVPAQAARAAVVLEEHGRKEQFEAGRLESEVASWAERYRRAVEAHARGLLGAAARARLRHEEKVAVKTQELKERIFQAEEAVRFAEQFLLSCALGSDSTSAHVSKLDLVLYDLTIDYRQLHCYTVAKLLCWFTVKVLNEAREDEVLSLSGPILRRLERVCDLASLSEPPRCEMRFSPTAPAHKDEFQLYGRLLTKTPDATRTVLVSDGLRDLRVEHEHTLEVETRDANGERVWAGGASVAAYLRRSDSSAPPSVLRVSDRGDGVYALTLTPPKPGAYLLAITLDNKPIKGSPYECAARVARAHSGKFHCCAFCSSGGRRDAHCACGSVMAPGYKGCGHGHAGHPGARHWSCCGSLQRRGECMRPLTQTYQFSL
ncbi:Tripartite motif-containing protein 45 [Eumeta japonica]|uniref:Tripartite motif-containing protein 45 n=1 Tax=Eumeta variegata TaxID=151549 RepID=A0A4C1ZIE9_EUMVA|nr:Tripartite motif-containing protein 45 [Eumeta japonica]